MTTSKALPQLTQVHVLTSNALSNLSRDDQGHPKSFMFGGIIRPRPSLQCIKRAMRTPNEIAMALSALHGVRANACFAESTPAA